MQRPLILTMGDPAGIGPEIIVQAAGDGALDGLGRPVLVAGDPAALKRAARVCGRRWECEYVPKIACGEPLCKVRIDGRELDLVARSDLGNALPGFGQPNAPAGQAMVDYIDWAIDRCLSGEAAGMVTGPINKRALQAAGARYPGHTELLAARCQTDQVVMMLAGARLRVCLVTIHCPLRMVPQQLSRERILATLRITAAALRHDFGLEQPRLAVLALNPHAGEDGLFGDEEQRLIAPAIAAARDEGVAASGPHSADSLFWFASQGAYDAVICMYHDQGLIPLKLLHFADGVNVTLGLPIVRTSVDHGTAYDLAGTGRADPASLVAALRMAAQMADNREHSNFPPRRDPASSP